MSQSKVTKITIRNKPGTEGKLSSGMNTEVLLDGKRVGGATFVKIEANARKLTKVTLEMFAEVEVEADVELQTVKEEPFSKSLVKRTVSNADAVQKDFESRKK